MDNIAVWLTSTMSLEVDWRLIDNLRFRCWNNSLTQGRIITNRVTTTLLTFNDFQTRANFDQLLILMKKWQRGANRQRIAFD